MTEQAKPVRSGNHITCARCRTLVAATVRRDDGWQLVPLNGATLLEQRGRAPRVRCPCGVVSILLDGSL